MCLYITCVRYQSVCMSHTGAYIARVVGHAETQIYKTVLLWEAAVHRHRTQARNASFSV